MIGKHLPGEWDVAANRRIQLLRQPLGAMQVGAELPVNDSKAVQDQETVLEWNYTLRFRNGAFFIEPDMQYIIRPGGIGNIPNALMVGAQVGINF